MNIKIFLKMILIFLGALFAFVILATTLSNIYMPSPGVLYYPGEG
jgi:hypothetical protein